MKEKLIGFIFILSSVLLIGIVSSVPEGYSCGYMSGGGPFCDSGLACENFQCVSVSNGDEPLPGDGECKYFNGILWCCNNAGEIFCDSSNHDICGTPTYCQNYNNPQLSCIPGEDWCCFDAGWVADYSSHRCCNPDYPFHFSLDDTCWNARTPTSNNYYTNLAQCKYIWNFVSSVWEIEEKCEGTDLIICEKNGIKTFVDGWDNAGKIMGKCGVECNLGGEKCIGTSFYMCGNFVWINQGEVEGKCGYVPKECNTGEEKCIETVSYDCENDVWVEKGEIVGKCGYVIEECTTGEEKCIETISYSCENNLWVNKGEVNGKCGYGDENEETFYRFQNNACAEISILPSEKTSNDYSTLSECEENIDPSEPSPTTNYLPIIIGVSLFIVFLILLVIFWIRRRNRY